MRPTLLWNLDNMVRAGAPEAEAWAHAPFCRPYHFFIISDLPALPLYNFPFYGPYRFGHSATCAVFTSVLPFPHPGNSTGVAVLPFSYRFNALLVLPFLPFYPPPTSGFPVFHFTIFRPYHCFNHVSSPPGLTISPCLPFLLAPLPVSAFSLVPF